MPMIFGISPLEIPGSFSIANQQLYTSLQNHSLRPSVENAVRVCGLPTSSLVHLEKLSCQKQGQKVMLRFFSSADQTCHLCISMKTPIEDQSWFSGIQPFKGILERSHFHIIFHFHHYRRTWHISLLENAARREKSFNMLQPNNSIHPTVFFELETFQTSVMLDGDFPEYPTNHGLL